MAFRTVLADKIRRRRLGGYLRIQVSGLLTLVSAERSAGYSPLCSATHISEYDLMNNDYPGLTLSSSGVRCIAPLRYSVIHWTIIAAIN